VVGQRLKKLKTLVNKIYKNKQEARKWKNFSGYVMGFDKDKILVREELQAPEIDEYDRIWEINIISWKKEIGEKVKYKL
jgi:hypothetical protein